MVVSSNIQKRVAAAAKEVTQAKAKTAAAKKVKTDLEKQLKQANAAIKVAEKEEKDAMEWHDHVANSGKNIGVNGAGNNDSGQANGNGNRGGGINGGVAGNKGVRKAMKKARKVGMKRRRRGRRAVNGFFKLMMKAKAADAPSFVFNGKTYKKKIRGQLHFYKS
jgi:hypothetical protein